jgi:hypothetical protein
MLHELLLALSGDSGGIFVRRGKEGLQVGVMKYLIDIKNIISSIATASNL